MTNLQKLHCGIWPWTVGLKSRLPLHYKRRYVERWMIEPTPVHYRPEIRKFIADEFGQPVRVQNTPIPITFTNESDKGLWGGEGLVVGFKKKNNDSMKPRYAKIWKPNLLSRALYSEILDRWMLLTVTIRTLDLIDEAYGFDHYIFKTHEVDLSSKLGMKLKREMLLTLSRRSMYPSDLAKCEAIYAKYKEYLISEEEAEWVGLSLYEAERKQHEIEELERLQSVRPLKSECFDNLSKRLADAKMSNDNSPTASWLQKLSPFKRNNESSV